MFLLEGPQAVAEALTFRLELVVELFADADGARALHRHRPGAVDAGRRRRVRHRAGARHDGRHGHPAGRHRRLPAVPDLGEGRRSDARSRPKLVAILEEVRDPGNAGTIIRAADAAGADGVIFTGRSVDLYNPKVVRSTTGSIFHLPVAVGADARTPCSSGPGRRAQVLAADVKGDDLLARARPACSRSRPRGCSATRRTGSPTSSSRSPTAVMTVPIYGHAESMNLATAASVCLYESAFAQRSSVTRTCNRRSRAGGTLGRSEP